MCHDSLHDLREFLANRELHKRFVIEDISSRILADGQRSKELLEELRSLTTFSEALNSRLAKRGIKHTDFYSDSMSYVGASTWSNMQLEDYVPARDTVNKCILALRLDILEAALLRDKAGYTFMWNNKREMAIYFFIMKGIYDPNKVDCHLHECGFKTLFT